MRFTPTVKKTSKEINTTLEERQSPSLSKQRELLEREWTKILDKSKCL